MQTSPITNTADCRVVISNSYHYFAAIRDSILLYCELKTVLSRDQHVYDVNICIMCIQFQCDLKAISSNQT